jgi:hypothetical protein
VTEFFRQWDNQSSSDTIEATEREENMRAMSSHPEEFIFKEWVGAWALAPENEKDARAAELARASMKFTKSGSFTSPVAVASIDILGIKDVLSKMSLVQAAERFVDHFYDQRAPAYHMSNVEVSEEEMASLAFRRLAATYSVSVSDTILLARRPDWEIGDRAIAEANAVIVMADQVCRMIRINSSLGVPLRAAIAFGECLISVGERHAVLGLATGEASAWERQQEWIGGMLTPSAVAALRNGAEAANRLYGPPKLPDWLASYPIPLKPDCPALPEPQIALNWMTGQISGWAMFVDAVVPEEPSGDLPEDVRRKHLNTRAFAKHCEGRPLPPIEF